MLLANINGEKIRATPRARAWCPGCGSAVIAKCGEILIWHWAHETMAECDPWHECESAWHLNWKAHFEPEQCEVVMGPHRADIVDRGGMVIELQHSSLSPAEVRERETFYRSMLWIIDASEFAERISFASPRFNGRKTYQRFGWERPREWMLSITKRVYFDFGNPGRMLAIFQAHPTIGGEWTRTSSGDFWGEWIDKRQFIRNVGGKVDDDQGVVAGVLGAPQAPQPAH